MLFHVTSFLLPPLAPPPPPRPAPVALPQTHGSDRARPRSLPALLACFLERPHGKTFLDGNAALTFPQQCITQGLLAPRSLPSVSLINIDRVFRKYLKASVSQRGCNNAPGELTDVKNQNWPILPQISLNAYIIYVLGCAGLAAWDWGNGPESN